MPDYRPLHHCEHLTYVQCCNRILYSSHNNNVGSLITSHNKQPYLQQAAVTPYSTVCTSKENFLSGNTTKRRHQLLAMLPRSLRQFIQLPDLTPSDYLWGHTKAMAYRQNSQTTEQLQLNMQSTDSVHRNHEIIINETHWVLGCVELCICSGGGHFEQCNINERVWYYLIKTCLSSML
jgi:hypothetical protein